METLIIVILLAVVFLIMFSRGERRLVLLIAGIFFLNDTIAIKPFSSYTLLLTGFFFSLVIHKELKKDWKIFPFKWLLIALLIITWLIVQFDERSFPPLTYISRVFNNFVPRFMALFVGYSAITSVKVWERSAKPLGFVFLIVCLYGFVTYVLQSNPYDDMLHMAFGGELGIWWFVQERGYRVFSTLNNPIVYGYVMFLVTTYLYLQRKNYGRITYLMLSLLTILNAFMSNSRTGLLAGALLIAVYALVEYRFSYRIVGYLATTIVLFVVLYQNVAFVQNAADSVLDIFLTGGENTSGSTIDLRETQLETSLLFFYLHPWLGNGFNYFHEVIRTQYDTNLMGLAGLEGYGYKLLVEEGSLMIISVVLLYSSMLLFFIRRLNIRQYASMAIAWIVSFFFFLFGTGEYGGIYTIGMLFIGMLLRYVQLQSQKEMNISKK